MKAKRKALTQSILDRLRNRARERGQAFDHVLTYYGIERFLYRLSRSKYCDLLVLKGALLMRTWPEGLERATRDIDLRAFSDPDAEGVARMLREICLQPVEEDGMLFDPASLTVETIAERARYPGVRAKLWGKLGNARVRIGLDIGFSDPVTIDPERVDYPTLLDMPVPRLRVYPRETIVAEKIEAIVQLGELNSRMKDFYDLRAMADAFHFEGPMLADCIRSTFEARATSIPAGVPVGLSDDFARERQGQWTAFLRRIGQEGADSTDFQDVVRGLRRFILPLLQAARQEEQTNQTWDPREGDQRRTRWKMPEG